MSKYLFYLGVLGIITICGACKKNEPPLAFFNASPRLAHYSQEFTFDASASRDVQTRDHELVIRWDFESDNTWDTDWTANKIATHYYSEKGSYIVLLQVRNLNGEITEARRQVEATLLNLKDIIVDVRDGKEYKTVLIDSIWWFAQNLHHGKWISIWENAVQVDNGIIERYGQTDFENLDINSGYYNYEEAMNYDFGEKVQGVCPPGWYIPDNDEWISLVDHVGDKKDPGIFLSIIGDEGVNLAFSGRRYLGWGQSVIEPGGLYWSSSGSYQIKPYGISFFSYPKDTSHLRPINLEPGDSLYSVYYQKYALPIRCVKKNQR